MKYSLASVAATGLFVSGSLAQPHFTNSKINPQEGEPFKLTVSGCEEGCKITLQKGPNKDSLQDFRTLATGVTESKEVTLTDLASGTYNFKVTNEEDGTHDFSKQFDYTGTASSTDESSSESAPATTSSESESEAMTSTSAPASTSASATASSTSEKASTSASDASSSSPTSNPAAFPTVAPAALAGGAIAALFL
ncbi:hypothetical protein K4F52_003093 [Lecanicillium sp. MT-2017a]|nr:hypothetical protein K4F52_003093 [Lecanicillium sp. MT-2017a]